MRCSLCAAVCVCLHLFCYGPALGRHCRGRGGKDGARKAKTSQHNWSRTDRGLLILLLIYLTLVLDFGAQSEIKTRDHFYPQVLNKGELCVFVLNRFQGVNHMR